MKPKTFLIIYVLIVAGFLIYVFCTNTNLINPQPAIKIQELSKKRDSVLTKVVQQSKINAERGNALIKQLPNEKIIIRDTTNNAMFEYITNYKYSE